MEGGDSTGGGQSTGEVIPLGGLWNLSKPQRSARDGVAPEVESAQRWAGYLRLSITVLGPGGCL